MNAKWRWKLHISNLLKKLCYIRSVLNRISYSGWQDSHCVYFNGSVSPHLDYGDIVWGDQPGLKSEMDRLQAFQNRFAKKIPGKKISSSEALNSLQWIPLVGRRFAHRCSVVQNAISILLHEKFLQFDWLRAVALQLNLKYPHVKITKILRVVI